MPKVSEQYQAAAELARGVLFTGFPWVASGYSQVEGPLAALAPWIGVYGIGAVLAALAAGLARAVTARGGKSRMRDQERKQGAKERNLPPLR